MLRSHPPLLAASGEVRIERGRISTRMCKRIALFAGLTALLVNDDPDYLHPLRYGSHNYMGQYHSREKFPRYLISLTNKLDNDFPEDFTRVSVLRSRVYRAGYHHEGDHLDSTSDYRHLVIVGGSGTFIHRPYISTPESRVAEPVNTGDVITLNNTERSMRTWHHIEPNGSIAMIVYGKMLEQALSEPARKIITG